MTSNELLYSDPLACAGVAAGEIITRTGVASHDIALVMGSGWVSAVDALGTPTYECNAEELTGFLPPQLKVTQEKFVHISLNLMVKASVRLYFWVVRIYMKVKVLSPLFIMSAQPSRLAVKLLF